MANEQNLIQNSNRTEAEKRALSVKGGKQSQIVQKRKRKMKETMQMLLDLKIPESKAKKQLLDLGIDEEDATMQSGILFKQVTKALNGDNESAKFCRDTSGQYIGAEVIEDNKENNNICIPAKDIGKAFVDLNRSIDNREYLEYWLRGGRGSVKSSYWSEKVAELLENNPNMCAILIRKVGNTMKDSIYSQMQWGLDKLAETYPEVREHWKALKSPLEFTNT